jgi:hypothetical protein
MRILRFVTLFLIGATLGAGVVGGTMVAAASANISRSYKSNDSITAGSLVSLNPRQAGYVLIANSQNGQHLLGVAVSSNDSLIAVNTTPGDIQVALSGVVNTLVSTLNGPIAIGDQITVSPINGVGMKANPGSKVVGVSQANFTVGSPGATSRQVTNKSGEASSVVVGYIPLAVAIGTAPSLLNGPGTATNVLQRIANSVAGHTVSTLPVVVSTIIALVAIVSVVTLIYGTIRGSIISIGRNPLAKPAIFESLAQVIGMATLIVVIAVVIIYLVLR